MNPPIPLPDLVYSLLIEKHLDEATCVALAMSGAFNGFSSAFTRSRSWKGLVVNEQCFYFTPTLWSEFVEQHIALDSIKVFNANHFYWLPGHLLFSTIIQMENLEELSIKGTQVCTVHQMARILQSCPKIKKLDFTYTEKSQEDIAIGLKNENLSLESLTAGFKKLTSLKLSTTVPDPKHDVFKDPWLLIIKMLSYCRDCTDLAIEITYTGKPWSPFDRQQRGTSKQIMVQDSVKIAIERDWFPQLEWMQSLKSLVLVKLGPYGSRAAGAQVISILLNSLCGYLFPNGENNPTPRPLKCIWIENFEVNPFRALDYAIPECLRSFKTGDRFINEVQMGSFLNLENFYGTVTHYPSKSLLSSSSKLKYYCGRWYTYEEMYKFCEVHRILQHLEILFLSAADAAKHPVIFFLPKLHFLSYQCFDISKELVEAISEAYPNLEILQLLVLRNETRNCDDIVSLSALSFPKLTSLTIRGFDLRDGAFLLSIIEKCPKIHTLHLEIDSIECSSFLKNLKKFLQRAENLREFQLKWNHHGDDFPLTALSILKSILEKSVLLERLALIDGGSDNLPIWSHPTDFADLMVEFASKMSHLTCCCLSFKQLDSFLIVNVKQRIAQEVAQMRPSLWFHLDRSLPHASDPGVPWVHYHQIVDLKSSVLPRF